MRTIDEIFPNGVCGILRTVDPDAGFQACLAAITGGIGTIEVTTTVPSCFEMVRGLIATTGGKTPIGVLPPVVAIRPRTISKQDGTVVVTSMVPMPPVMAARQAWNPASGSTVRRMPQTPLGKISSMVRTAGPILPPAGD